MRCCVWQLIEEEEELAKRVFKKCNNIKRLTKNKKAEMMLELEQQQDYKELKELLTEEFKTQKDLYIHLLPALRTKKNDMSRHGLENR